MATLVSNCGGDENGNLWGGVAGDQTGREYKVCEWSYWGQTAVYRHPDAKVRATIAKLAWAAANNNRIGYDQSQRLTFRNQLRKVNYDPSKITVSCEADCSASTAAIIEGVGALLGNDKLYDFDSTISTHTMDGALRAAGFTKLTASKYLNSGDYLLAGDIQLQPAYHVNVVITNGSKSGTSAEPTTSNEEFPMSKTLRFNTEVYVRTSPTAKNMSNVAKSGGEYVTYTRGETVDIEGVVLSEGRMWAYYTGATSKKRRYFSLGPISNAEVV